MAATPSGTVTFLFTDIEGSTERWEQHPDAMQAALAAPRDPASLKKRAADFAPEIAAKRYLELLCP